jgi:hypothetical protein
MMQSPTARKILSATDRSLTMASWNPQAEATLKAVLMRCQPPAHEGGGWFQKFQVELFNKCQPHERQLLNKFMAQTLAAKVKAFYESAGKENGEFSFFFFGSFLTLSASAASRWRSSFYQLRSADAASGEYDAVQAPISAAAEHVQRRRRAD